MVTVSFACNDEHGYNTGAWECEKQIKDLLQ